MKTMIMTTHFKAWYSAKVQNKLYEDVIHIEARSRLQAEKALKSHLDKSGVTDVKMIRWNKAHYDLIRTEDLQSRKNYGWIIQGSSGTIIGALDSKSEKSRFKYTVRFWVEGGDFYEEPILTNALDWWHIYNSARSGDGTYRLNEESPPFIIGDFILANQLESQI